MEWTDQAILLSARPYGETAALVTVMTRHHGRHAGLLPGGQSARKQADLEVGTELNVTWRGRISDSLGTWSLESLHHHAAAVLADPVRLAALSSACSLVEVGMPEREPHSSVFDGFLALFEALKGDVWDAAYIFWELALLREMGFGLELDRCAVTGNSDNLIWVSPRTGRAVSREAGEPYREKLLPLPGFLTGQSGYSREQAIQGLKLVEYFLTHYALASRDIPLPPARTRFAERYERLREETLCG